MSLVHWDFVPTIGDAILPWCAITHTPPFFSQAPEPSPELNTTLAKRRQQVSSEGDRLRGRVKRRLVSPELPLALAPSPLERPGNRAWS
ncbi:hypothetical protein PoMZ_04371 [Pyricularia oryzae]|uniref:Uncharacterized protein n=2 Tax=Pyricularia oryzae TaxID=318829 RepID=A0A4P7NDP2_PYROR|nr:hypothetical protein PoMZ_04371 [Pyricularia oryzae]